MGQRPSQSVDSPVLSWQELEDNFKDLHPALNAQEIQVESTRCLYCYDAPCIQACPTSINIPKFIRQLATGNPTGSAKTILTSNIMGGTCARACPTEVLCEQRCVLNDGEHEPIKIGQLQRSAVDHLLDTAQEYPFMRAPETGKKVAVIGAGPAGLSCAHGLARLGHRVVVFESRAKAGGLNEYGLAAYKMVDDFAAREVEFILQLGGIDIQYGKALGSAVSLTQLQQDYDAVFIGIGLGKAHQLSLPGADLSGIGDAIEFIEQLRQADDIAMMKPGNNVLVIGGGNTAIDAAVQSKRLGADQVTLIYRRGAHQMGATDFEQDLAAINGVNVIHWAMPVGFTGESSVQSAEFEHCAIIDGKLSGNGDIFSIDADCVLLAVGQYMVDEGLNSLDLEKGKISVDEHFKTSLNGVYAGGDCVHSGEDLTVQSVEDGKRASKAINEFLMEV